MDIKGKVIIITGASAGIGLAAARSADKLRDLARELESQGAEAIPVETDMRDQASVQRMVQEAVQRFGRVDVLINNAGQAIAGTVADLDLDALRQIFDLNIMGVLYAMQAVIPEMRKNGGGLIANVSSMVSKMTIPGLSGYASTKAALNLITQTARGELAGDNIRVMTIFPRMTATDFGKNSLGHRAMREQQRAGQSDSPASGHAGPPGDRPAPVIDSADHVANRIVQALREEPAEQYME